MDGKMNVENVSRFGRSFSIVRIPYSLKLLIHELQVMNVQMRIITEDNIDQLTSMSYSDNINKLVKNDNPKLSDVINSVKVELNKVKRSHKPHIPKEKPELPTLNDSDSPAYNPRSPEDSPVYNPLSPEDSPTYNPESPYFEPQSPEEPPPRSFEENDDKLSERDKAMLQRFYLKNMEEKQKKAENKELEEVLSMAAKIVSEHKAEPKTETIVVEEKPKASILEIESEEKSDEKSEDKTTSNSSETKKVTINFDEKK